MWDIEFVLVFLFFCFLYTRLFIVARARNKIIDDIRDYALWIIDEKPDKMREYFGQHTPDDFYHQYLEISMLSYLSQIFDLTKWNKKSISSRLYEDMKEDGCEI